MRRSQKYSSAVALFNPVYALVLPFLFVVTLPLAIFAGITTTFAFSILVFRVVTVYLDIFISLFVRSMMGFFKTKTLSFQESPVSATSGNSNTISPSASALQLRRYRRRRRSSVSGMSAGSITPVSEVGLGLIPSVGAERDFEGVGGWREGGDDDAVWMAINSRLELPDRQHSRNHHRTLSGGPTTPGDGGFLMMKGRTRSPDKAVPQSPNSSRTRAPSVSRFSLTNLTQAEGYFPMTSIPNKAAKRVSPPVAM